MRRTVFWGVVLGIFIVGLVGGPDLWAAPGQCPKRQTVPTRTPTPPPPPTPTSRPPKAQPTPVPAATAEPTPTEAPSEPLLPAAGGRNVGLQVGVVLVGIGLLVLAVIGRRMWQQI